jgi:hypothetical protein
MNRAILVLVILFPIALAAQEKDSGSMKNQSETVAAEQAKASPLSDAASAQTDSSADLPSSDPDPNAPQQPNAKPSQPTPPRAEAKRKIPGSMVGYIDNPIVESEVRIRFDGAFNDQFPDRAEFFYAKCSCYRNNGTDPNAPGPGTGIPKSVNFQQLYFDGEYAPSSRFSVFAEIPIRWLQPQGFITSAYTIAKNFLPYPNESGIGDVMAGFKFAPLASASHYLTFQFRTYFPSGDASRGLGTNHYSVEPAVLYYKRLSERLALEAQVRDWHPIGGSKAPPVTSATPPQVGAAPQRTGVPTNSSDRFTGDVFIYGIGPSYGLYNGEHLRFTPVVELVGWRVLSGFETATVVNGVPQPGFSDAGGTNIVNIKIGARTLFGDHNSFYVGYGRPLTSADWYDDIVRAEYRYSF